MGSADSPPLEKMDEKLNWLVKLMMIIIVIIIDHYPSS